ncbi:2-hydroxyacid dehydrogenase [Burkholderia plantarii]|uniref:Putative D-isomer specific 2-hydoxyacid dehydrogenase, catalytic region n=1 Tax=Burkholderia plantarii TaxID=41899 RepID=A0A0B6RSX4_BURPL|nr:2-hydroxyacid dehydrogenase [Burkholderia plantarii]AJK48417.1 putative D-isomer specific 2-hydoxyacid dehydrogenase, catalytic region [Burkholderia plantarii]ALK32636.1 D-isomer specific 2-hydroxyacid dehydrogenase [Burkholderia plantarii]GLZ20014.1 dehydrogenase [Burkholderia plantarii]
MPSDILLINPVLPSLDRQLAERYTLHRHYGQADPAAHLREIGARIGGVVTGGASGIRNAVMDQLPNLKIVAINGIGTDAVDLAYARERGLHVSTTPGVLTDDVADLAIGLLLSVCRGLCQGDAQVRAGQWGKAAALPLARKFSGMRIGIVGLGRVGRAIAARAAAFGCPIAYTDLRELDGVPYRFVADLAQLAADSDALVLAASADNAERIIDATVLDALGPDGYLINVARGKLVDEPALVRALAERRIAGAGLDVFVDEPNVPPELFALPNVVLQPHRASATVQTREAMGAIVLDSLAASFAGRRPATSVTP